MSGSKWWGSLLLLYITCRSIVCISSQRNVVWRRCSAIWMFRIVTEIITATLVWGDSQIEEKWYSRLDMFRYVCWIWKQLRYIYIWWFYSLSLVVFKYNIQYMYKTNLNITENKILILLNWKNNQWTDLDLPICHYFWVVGGSIIHIFYGRSLALQKTTTL